MYIKFELFFNWTDFILTTPLRCSRYASCGHFVSATIIYVNNIIFGISVPDYPILSLKASFYNILEFLRMYFVYFISIHIYNIKFPYDKLMSFSYYYSDTNA